MSYFTQAQVDAHNAKVAQGRCQSVPVSSDAVAAGEEVEKLHEPTRKWLMQRGIAFAYNRPDKASTSTPGAPDFIIAAGGGLWIEYKTRDGKLTPEQHIWHHLAERHGVNVHVLRSMREFSEIMKEKGLE